MKKTPESNSIIRIRASPTSGNAIKTMCAQCMGCTDDNIEPGLYALIRAYTRLYKPTMRFVCVQALSSKAEYYLGT